MAYMSSLQMIGHDTNCHFGSFSARQDISCDPGFYIINLIARLHVKRAIRSFHSAQPFLPFASLPPSSDPRVTNSRAVA